MRIARLARSIVVPIARDAYKKIRRAESWNRDLEIYFSEYHPPACNAA